LRWPTIKLFPQYLAEESLASCEGAAEFKIDLAQLGGEQTRWRIPAFEIESTEVSVSKYQRFHPTKSEHRGQSGEFPAGFVSWDEATVYAESRGLRLPDLLEAELLATHGGAQKYPWGNSPPPADNWQPRPVDAATHDRLETAPPITGLYSSLLEWTATRTRLGVGSDTRPGLRFIVRGGPSHLISTVFPLAQWSSVNQYASRRALGVRCARSPRPRLNAMDVISRLP
jgi:formylglycine-generating enzyme required for sulfatase activity